MPIYEKPVWKLMYDMVEDLGIRRGEVFSKEQALVWFSEHYPKIKQSTVSAHLIRLSINAPGRIHHRPKPEVDDLFFKIDAQHFRLYDAESDPAPIYGAPERPGRPGRAAGAEPSLANEVLAVIERHEGSWRGRLEASEERVRALEQENEGLREELERGGSAADEIVDEVLKERVSMLDSAPLDTVIREAGVVLEDRLRVAGGADSALAWDGPG